MGSHRDVHILRTGKALIFRLPAPRLDFAIERLLDSHDSPTRRAATEVHAHKKLFSNRILIGDDNLRLTFQPFERAVERGVLEGESALDLELVKIYEVLQSGHAHGPGPKPS